MLSRYHCLSPPHLPLEQDMSLATNRWLRPSAAWPARALILTMAASLAGCGGSSPEGFNSTLNQPGKAPAVAEAKTAVTTGSLAATSINPLANAATPAAHTGSNAAFTASAGRADAGLSGSTFPGATPVVADPSASRTVAALTAPQKPGSKAYRIGADDMLEISVYKVPDLSKALQVTDTGIITYPLVGEIAAAGRTTGELEHELAQKLGAKYLQNPQVTVFVKEYNSQRILVDGAFVKPGVYPVRGQGTLLQYVATSGGLMPNAESTIVIFRTVDGKQLAARFEIDEIRSGKSPDPEVKAGDVIVASNSAFKEGLDKLLKVIPLVGTFAQVAVL